MKPSPLALAVGGPLVLYLVLAATTMQHYAPSGDTATWGVPGVQQTVVLVDRDGNRTTAQDRGHRCEMGPVAFEHTDHRYRGVVEVMGLRLPWMQNEYTSAIPDWPSAVVFRATGSFAAAQWMVLLLGGLTLLLASLFVGRELGPVAAAVCGLWLATDSWFHAYKHILNGTEVAMQLLAVLAIATALEMSRQGGRWRPVVAHGFVVGLAICVKLPFAALALAVGGSWFLLVRGWRDFERPVAAFALMALGLVLGLAPNLAWWGDTRGLGHQPGEPILQGADTWEGRLREVERRHQARKDDRKKVSPWTFATAGGAWWSAHWHRKGQATNRGQDLRPSPSRDTRPGGGLLPSVGFGMLVVVALLGVLGALRGSLTGEMDGAFLAVWLAVGAVVFLPIVYRIHPDAHHLALWLPLLPAALGAGATLAWAHPRTRRVAGLGLGVALVLLVPTRVADLVRADGALVDASGRLADRENLEELVAVLVEEGITEPAVLTYELASLLEGLSRGRVRPWNYWRANNPRQGRLPEHGSDAWIESILRSHAGGHLILAVAPPQLVDAPGGRTWFSPTDLARAGAQVGLEPVVVREMNDAQGRWFATIYALRPSR